MSDQPRSPRIARCTWGRIEIEGGLAFKDAKLYPGGARQWDWRETGTNHTPGIQPGDVEELLERGATVVVLSSGMLQRLRVTPEATSLLDERGVESHVLPTRQAVELYNRLTEQHAAVGGLFHTTC